MGLQTKILRRTVDFNLADGHPFRSGTGTLIGGTPGQIYDVAYGPVVHTTTLTEAADIGSFVPGQGVIVNAPEYALYGTGVGQGAALAPSLTLPAGTVVSCMTAGHVWIQRKHLTAIATGMNAAVIWQQAPSDADDSSADTDLDLLVVEVNGMTKYGPDESTANG